ATVEYGASVSLTATPVSGYKLEGWYVDDEKVCDTDVYTFTMPANEYTVEARFTEQSYQFAFSAESGKGTAVSSQQLGTSVLFGTEITLIATANTGYTFEGWYVGNNKVQNATATYTFTMPAMDYILVAKFSTNAYTLNYSSEDTEMGSVTSETQNNSQVAFGEQVTLTATANTGYDFEGWYENGQKVSTSATWTFNMPSNSRTLQARFTPKQHTLIYTVYNQAYGSVESQVESNSQVNYNAIVTLTAVPASDGYQFDGWFIDGQLESDDFVYELTMPNGNVSLEARFSIKSFTLTYNVDEQSRGSISCITTSGSQVQYATSITLTATEKAGYDFDGWYVGGVKLNVSSNVYTFTMPANNYSVEARFVPEQYTLSYLSEDTEKGTVSSETATNSKVNYGTSITVTATEKAGYVFVAWYDKLGNVASYNKEYSFTMTGEVTLTAKFEKAKYTLTYSSKDQVMGTVSSATVSGSKVEYLTSITLTATEKTGYDFEGWYVDDEKIENATATFTFTMPADDYTIEARFVPEKRTVEFKDGNDRIALVSVDYNTSVSSYNYTKNGYSFEGWFIKQGGQEVVFDFANSKITENITLYAKMVKDKVYYDLQFVEDDGTTKVGEVQKVEEGTTFTNIPTTSKTGYNFMGWEYYNSTTEKYEKFDENTVVNEDLTVRAIYSPIQLKVRLYSQNIKVDQNIINTLTVNYNEKAIKPQNPEKEGFLFVKWVYFDNQTAEFDFNQKLTANVDLLAIWQEKPAETFTVNFYDGYEIINDEIIDGESIYSHEVQKNGTVSAPNDPEKTGYTFVGWKYFDQPQQLVDYTDSVAITENLKVYAIFEINTFKVTFKDYDGSTLEEQTVEYGSSAVAPTDPIRTGYTFNGCDKAFDNVTEELTITAKYIIIEFTVQFIIDGEQPIVQTLGYGEEISVPQTPSKAGYTFGGWYTTETFEEGTKYVFAGNPVTDDVILYAKFDEIIILEYTVTFKDYDNSIISTQKIVEGNSAIDPGKQEREGYTFTGWDKEFDVITEDLEITAQYQINTYKVTFKDYDGSILKSEQLVEYGSSAVAPANPTRTGYDFNGWDKSFDNVQEDLTITAKYTVIKFTVQFIVEGKEPIVQEIEYGKVANYITATKAGCKFLFWHLDGESEEFNFSTIITENLTLYAEFETLVNTYTVEFKVYDQEQGYVTYGNVQYVSADYGYVIELAPYKDQFGTTYQWCYKDGENYIAFDFGQKITDSIILYAYVEEVK
ncbi:MAG: InlB B-repeat-containing protein, partial [Clostridia bacterium]|nr:InlB B-repeat-containing protein [Clostridia bacterium]